MLLVITLDDDDDDDTNSNTYSYNGNISTDTTQPAASNTSDDAEKVEKKASSHKSQNICDLWNQPYSTQSQRHKSLCRAVSQYLLKEGQPIYTVERSGFRQMLAEFDSR